MIINHFNKNRLEYWCNKIPECSKFLRTFFAPIKSHEDMHKSLMDYLDNISRCMANQTHAEQYSMTSDQFKQYHQELMDAYHEIIIVDANLKKTVY